MDAIVVGAIITGATSVAAGAVSTAGLLLNGRAERRARSAAEEYAKRTERNAEQALRRVKSERDAAIRERDDARRRLRDCRCDGVNG